MPSNFPVFVTSIFRRDAIKVSCIKGPCFFPDLNKCNNTNNNISGINISALAISKTTTAAST